VYAARAGCGELGATPIDLSGRVVGHVSRKEISVHSSKVERLPVRKLGRQFLVVLFACCFVSALTVSAALPAAASTRATTPRAATHALARAGASAGAGASAFPPTPPPNAHLTYWGGPVMNQVKIYGVEWGSGTYLPQMSGAAPNVPSFLTQLTSGTWMDLLSEYSAGGQTIVHGTFAGMINISPSVGNDGSTIDDTANIQPELEAQINASNLPPVDGNTLYVLFFPKGKLITAGGGDSKHQFCAYHSATNNLNAIYAVMPYDASDLDPATPGVFGCGKSPGISNFDSVMSHEIAEAITDPLPVNFLAPPLGWLDPNNQPIDGGEVGDLCNHVTGLLVGSDTFTYTVQKQWSNQQHKCVTSGPPRRVSVGDASIAEGDVGTHNLQVPITLSAASTTPLTVHYSIAGSGVNPATAGSDFDDGGGSGSVTFPVKAVVENVSVPIFGDTTVESDETFAVTVTSVDPGYGVDRGTGTGTILNDDPQAGTTVSIGDGAIVVGQGKSKEAFALPISLSQALATNASVSFTTVLVSATKKDVAVKAAGTIKFAAGQTVANLVFTVKPHLAAGSDKTFTVTLSNAVGATVGRAVGTGTLLQA
jgi:hypothetical protein